MKRLASALIAILLCSGVASVADGPNGSYIKDTYAPFIPLAPIFSLPGRTDSSGNLYIVNDATGTGQSNLTPIANLQGRTDSSGNLYVNCSGCSSSTIAAPLTITGAANTASIVASGSSNTGADATVPWNLSHTLNTSGVPSVFKLAVTDTAHGAGTLLFNILAGAAGATSTFSVDTAGRVNAGTGSNVINYGFNQNTNVGLNYFSNGIIVQTSAAATGSPVYFKDSTIQLVGGANATNITWESGGIASGDDTGLGRNAAGVVEVNNGTAGTFRDLKLRTANTTSGYQVNGVASILNVASNFTTAANTNLQAITGLTALLPATTALNVPFSCKLLWSQATAAVAVSFGVQSDTVSPTNLNAMGQMETNLTVTSYGDVQNLTTTTATAVVTGTPAATATIYNAYIDGFLENPSNASTTTLNIMVKTATAGDVVTVYRGSFCRLF